MAAPEAIETAPITDEILIERGGRGDHDAFEILYQRYFPRVYRFVSRRIDNRSDVEETVQEVFINVFSSMSSFRGDAPFVAWVLGLTRRTIAARFKKKRHVTVPLEAEDPPQIHPLIPAQHREPTPLENYECSERIARLEKAAAHRLNADQWQLFRLFHLQHHSIHEIATATDKTEDAVKSNLYRARKLLLAP
ncbi:MAG: sigma-70 family RNA polymerase sigma factor [Myxococcales bacterium]|nr:sigma-70 family RNA polymerase sigma factor [Myxococcales bacterium]